MSIDPTAAINSIQIKIDTFEKAIQDSQKVKEEDFSKIEEVGNEIGVLLDLESDSARKSVLEKMQERLENVASTFWSALKKLVPTGDKSSERKYSSELSSMEAGLKEGLYPHCQSLFKKYGFRTNEWGVWCGFSIDHPKNPIKREGVNGYEDARRQWKCFLNPNKANFHIVLERLLQFAQKNEMSLQAKILKPHASRGPMGSNALDDPCEPKIILYFIDENSGKAKKRLADFIEKFEKQFTPAELEQFSCPEGRREIYVEEPKGSDKWVRKAVPQSGPSFCKMRNRLMFYSQGGYTESGRSTFIQGSFQAKQMRERFQGENFYMYKGETDPFGMDISDDKATPSKAAFQQYITEKMKTLPPSEQGDLFQKVIWPNLSKDKYGIFSEAASIYLKGKIERDPSFIQALSAGVMGSGDAEELLEQENIPHDTWLVRYSTNQGQWVVSLKLKSGEIEHYPCGNEKEAITFINNTFLMKNCLSPLFKGRMPIFKDLSGAKDAESHAKYLSTLPPEGLAKLFDELSSASSAAPTASVTYFNIWSKPSDIEFLEKASRRLMNWSDSKKALMEGLGKEGSSPAGMQRVKRMMVALQKRIMCSTTSRMKELAKGKFEKEDVSHREVAAYSGKSPAQLYAIQIQEAYEKVEAMDPAKIGPVVGITAEQVTQRLIAAETELWTENLLTEFGGDCLPETVIKMSEEEIVPYVEDLGIFLNTFASMLDNFSKPMTVLKLYNLQRNLLRIPSLPKDMVLQLTDSINRLIFKIVKDMPMKRQSSLLQLAQGHKYAGLLKIVEGTIFSSSKRAMGSYEYAPYQALSTQDSIEKIMAKAQEVDDTLSMIESDTSKYEALKEKLPPSIQEYLRKDVYFIRTNEAKFKDIVRILRNKLMNIQQRQKYRMEMLSRGFSVKLPSMFHATSSLDVAGLIASSTLRPSMSTSFYGTFTSTYPAMLRYGGVILGLPEDYFFHCELGKARERYHNPNEKIIFIPDKRGDIHSSVLHDVEREKWMGFSDHLYVNQKSKELKEKCLANLLFCLKQSFYKYTQSTGDLFLEESFSKFEKEIVANLEKIKFGFGFTPSASDPSRGRFTAQVQVGGRYTPFGDSELDALIQATTALPSFVKTLDRKSFMKEFQESCSADLEKASSPGLFDKMHGFLSGSSDKGLGIESSRRFPLHAHIIYIDEEEELRSYFQNNSHWPRAGKTGYHKTYSQKEIVEQLHQIMGKDRSLGAAVDTSKPLADKELEMAVQQKSAAEKDLYLKTHVVPLMEELIDFDFLNQQGVKVLTKWTEA